MSEQFRITISGGREKQTSTVIDDNHDNTAVCAAIKALETYKRHGLSSFPYNKSLKIEVSRTEPT